jgi:hypothetical protein
MLGRIALPCCALAVALAWAHELRARRRLARALDAERVLVAELRNVVALAPYARRYARRATQRRAAPRRSAVMMPMQRGREWHA